MYRPGTEDGGAREGTEDEDEDSEARGGTATDASLFPGETYLPGVIGAGPETLLADPAAPAPPAPPKARLEGGT